MSYLENIYNAIHLQSHYYGSVIIQDRTQHCLFSHSGESLSCQLGPLNTAHGEENRHHEKCMRHERERWARVAQSTDAARRHRIYLLRVCWLPFLRGTRSSRGAESFDSVSRSLPESELNSRVSSCAKLWTWRHLSHYLRYTIVKLPTFVTNASLKLPVAWPLLLCFSFHPLLVFSFLFHCQNLSLTHNHTFELSFCQTHLVHFIFFYFVSFNDTNIIYCQNIGNVCVIRDVLKYGKVLIIVQTVQTIIQNSSNAK